MIEYFILDCLFSFCCFSIIQQFNEVSRFTGSSTVNRTFSCTTNSIILSQLPNAINKFSHIKFHLFIFFDENGRLCIVFIKLGSLFHLGGFNWVFISYDLSWFPILLTEPYFITLPFPYFFREPDTFLTTPRILKLFSLFFNYFHLFAFSSFLEESYVIVFIEDVLSAKFFISVISPFFSSYLFYSYSSLNFGPRKSTLILLD